METTELLIIVSFDTLGTLPYYSTIQQWRIECQSYSKYNIHSNFKV